MYPPHPQKSCSGILCPHFSLHGVRAGCVLMSLSLITSSQECAGTAKVPVTLNIFLCPSPGVGEHLDRERQSVQSGCWARGSCNGGWRKRTLPALAWSNDGNRHFRAFVYSVRTLPVYFRQLLVRTLSLAGLSASHRRC